MKKFEKMKKEKVARARIVDPRGLVPEKPRVAYRRALRV